MNKTPTTQAWLSYFKSYSETQPDKHITVQKLLKLIQNPTVRAKDDAALITPFESNGKTGIHAAAAQFAAVVIDHDNDCLTEAEIREMYADFQVCYLAFTTASHTPEAPRWKVVIPFSQAVDADIAIPISRGIARYLGTDTAQSRKHQGFYAPNKLSKESDYIAITDCLGKPENWLQPDDTNSPFIVRAKQGWQEYQNELTKKAEAAEPKPRKTTTTSDSDNIISLIQNHHSIRELLERHGHKLQRGRYLSPFSHSGVAGGVILTRDGKEVFYSHHGNSCPLSHENHNGHALDAADVLCCLEYNGDFNRMIKEQADRLDAKGQEDRQREFMRKQEEERKRAEAANANSDPVDTNTGAGANASSDTSTDQGEQHRLTKTIDLDGIIEAVNWIVEGFISEGITAIAGSRGVGKTTAILPLGCVVAGLSTMKNVLRPSHWRHVVYITEDTAQAKRILAGYQQDLEIYVSAQRILKSGGNLEPDCDLVNIGVQQLIRERIHIVEACRMGADEVVEAGKPLKDAYTRTVTTTGADGKTYTTELLPLVVIDTLPATIQLENENDNAEASAAIAALKQKFEGLPTWIIGHTSKANLGRKDLESLSLRGASALESDVNQVLYLIEDDGKRWLIRGKTRFEAQWAELEIESHTHTITTVNRFGCFEDVTLRWSIAQPPEKSRKDLAEENKQQSQQQAQQELEQRIIETVEARYEEGQPVNRTALKTLIGGKRSTATDTINLLLDEYRLYEVEIPPRDRVNPNKKSFLISLSDEERETYKNSGELPAEKTQIPPSLKKSEKGTAGNGTQEIEPEK